MNLDPLLQQIRGTALEPLSPFLSNEYLSQITYGDFPKWRRLLGELPQLNAQFSDFGSTVKVGNAAEIDDDLKKALENQLREFIPWRKGPFEVFGIEIDTEWRSDIKWARLSQSITSLEGRNVLDVGSGNGYYGFRMLDEGAKLVLGIDPHIAYLAQFWAIKHFVPDAAAYVLPLTMEQMPGNLQYFDSVFSMGVLYHRRSPIDHLLELKAALRSGGELVLETLYVDGEEGYSLMPTKKYARMSNVWFVPSIPTIEQWLHRCGFVDLNVVDVSTTTLSEQRKTDWMPYDSLDDALDPEESELTIEGLPVPRRVVITARRP